MRVVAFPPSAHNNDVTARSTFCIFFVSTSRKIIKTKITTDGWVFMQPNTITFRSSLHIGAFIIGRLCLENKAKNHKQQSIVNWSMNFHRDSSAEIFTRALTLGPWQHFARTFKRNERKTKKYDRIGSALKLNDHELVNRRASCIT